MIIQGEERTVMILMVQDYEERQVFLKRDIQIFTTKKTLVLGTSK